MAIFAVVDSAGVILNRIILDEAASWDAETGHTLVEEIGPPLNIGGSFIDGVHTPPMEQTTAPPASAPAAISDRQFFQQLAVEGIITEEQALASNAAVIPAPLLAIIEQMPEDQQFAAKMVVSGATSFERQHPMTIAIGTAYGMSSEQIDEFFAAAAVL
jgi:hypothetical protein